MNLNLSKKILFSICFLIAGIFLVSKSGMLANAASGGSGLTLSPPIRELTIKEGETVTKTIKVTNPTDKLITVYPEVMDFRAKGDSGEPAFYSASDETSKFSLSKWITFTQPELALTPQQVVDFKYAISVPNTVEPGGHYGVVFFATKPEKPSADSSSVTLNSMVGSLLLVKVPGDITENASLENFSANQFIYLSGNPTFDTLVRNLGNIHFKPEGEIMIKNMLGGDSGKLTVNSQGGNVLPDSARKFENVWNDGKLHLGLYTAKVHLTYGDSGKTLDGSLTFLIIPWWILIIKIVVLILIIALITWLIIRRRRKKKAARNISPPQASPGKVILR